MMIDFTAEEQGRLTDSSLPLCRNCSGYYKTITFVFIFQTYPGKKCLSKTCEILELKT